MKKFNVLAAIIGIVALEAVAILQGIDGASLSSAFAIVGGLGGYAIAKSNK